MKGSKLSRRWVAMSLSAVLTIGLVAGCGLPGSEKSNAGKNENAASEAGKAAVSEPVELRFAWWGSQGRHDRTLKLIEKFQQLHPNIKIKPEYAAWGGYWEKLATQVAGANAPDLMQMSILYIKEYSERGVLADLSPYVGKELKVNDLDQEILKNQGTIQGKLTGIPVSDNASVLFYNKEMYQQAGVEPPKNDMTWKEYFDKARELKGKLGDKVYGAFDMSNSFEAFMYYVFSVGDVLYKDNRLGYKDETLKNWLAMWDNARKEGLVPPAAETAAFTTGGGDPNKDALMTGKTPLFGPSFTGTFPAYVNVLKQKVDMITFPADNRRGSVLETAMFLSASAKSNHVKEAAQFIDFFVNSTEAADILEAERGIPENKKIRQHLAPKFGDTEKKMIGMLEHVSKNNPSWYDAGPRGAGEVTQLFSQIVQKQQFGKATIDETVAEFRKEANKVFERNN